MKERSGFKVYESDGYILYIEEWEIKPGAIRLNTHMTDPDGTRIENPTITLEVNLFEILSGNFSKVTPSKIFKQIFGVGRGALELAKDNQKV